MKYLDAERLAAVDARAFQTASPFPWLSCAGLLSEAGLATLRRAAPGLVLFQRRFGESRAHGQQSHDRYALAYDEALPVADCWHEFAAELRGRTYRGFLRRLFGTRALQPSFHWHYTPRGCSVSPHCDARRKLGSHIFYLDTAEDWDPVWGGETLILDDGGRFARRSAPDFDDFRAQIPAPSLGNRSLLFGRTDHSWHGVREIRCPEGRMRRVFIVVVNRFGPVERLRSWLGAKPPGY